jgi:hypothetical protein
VELSLQETFYAGCEAPCLDAVRAAPRRRRSCKSRRKASAATLASLAALHAPTTDDEADMEDADMEDAVMEEAGPSCSAQQLQPSTDAAMRDAQAHAPCTSGSAGGASGDSVASATQPHAGPVLASLSAASAGAKPPALVVPPSSSGGQHHLGGKPPPRSEHGSGDGSPATASHSTESSQERLFGQQSSPLHGGTSSNGAPESEPRAWQ